MQDARSSAVEVPSPLRELIDGAMDRDKAYFEAHPEAECYVREYIPGELWPYVPEWPSEPVVVVRVVGPGVRTRHLFWPEQLHILEAQSFVERAQEMTRLGSDEQAAGSYQ